MKRDPVIAKTWRKNKVTIFLNKYSLLTGLDITSKEKLLSVGSTGTIIMKKHKKDYLIHTI